MAGRDDKVRREVLKKLCELFEDSPATSWWGSEFVEELGKKFDKDEIVYNIDRMDGKYLVNQSSLGESVLIINLTAGGIKTCIHKVMRRSATAISDMILERCCSKKTAVTLAMQRFHVTSGQ